MKTQEIPLFLEHCLVYDIISKKFNITIPVDVSEKILRHLCSKEKKNFHESITELKKKITKNKDISLSFYESYFQYKCSLFDNIHKGYDIYIDLPIEDIGRYLTLYKCPLDFANEKMIEACYPFGFAIYYDHGRVEHIKSHILQANKFHEYVHPPVRSSHERMSLENKRYQFYKHSKHYSKIVEDEAEYYIYIINSLLLKGLPLKEIKGNKYKDNKIF